MRKLAGIAVLLVTVAAFTLGPGILPKPPALVHVEAVHDEPSSRTIVRDFELRESSEHFTISVQNDIKRSGYIVQLLDGSGKMLIQLSFKANYKDSFPFNNGHGFQPGRYQVRVIEQGVVGRYSMSLYRGKLLPSGVPSQLLIVTLALGIAGASYGYSLRRNRGDRRASGVLKARYVLGCALFAFTMMIAYPLIHEVGHSIVLAHYGRWDLHGTDFIGLWGTPHAGRTAGPSLGPWGEAIMSIAGPMLPNLVGYLMFGIWLIFRRWFARSSATDVFWSGITACMLFAQVFAFVPMTGLVSDGDYNGYINNIPIPHWQANGLLLLFSAINAAIVVVVLKHLVRAYLRKRPAPH